MLAYPHNAPVNRIEDVVVGRSQTSNRKKAMTVAVGLVNPKFPHNIGSALRACSCFGAEQLSWTGERVTLDEPSKKGRRLPREERMKGYKEVTLRQTNRLFDDHPGLTPVAIELRPGSQSLPDFVHPDNALYVFGPEDGDLERVTLQHCHKFVIIPSRHCLNLAAAVYTVLYDRHIKRIALGLEDPFTVCEDRGFMESDIVPLEEDR